MNRKANIIHFLTYEKEGEKKANHYKNEEINF